MTSRNKHLPVSLIFGLATASSATLSEFCERFRARCKCKSQSKYPQMQNLNFTKSLLRNQNIKKIFKKIRNQPEIREKCARYHGNHGTRDYEVLV